MSDPMTKLRYENDQVSSPDHYKLFDGYEVLDLMQHQLNILEYKGYLYGNALKYILRWKKKNGLEDLKKCKRYLELMIEEEEGDGHWTRQCSIK